MRGRGGKGGIRCALCLCSASCSMTRGRVDRRYWREKRGTKGGDGRKQEGGERRGENERVPMVEMVFL